MPTSLNFDILLLVMRVVHARRCTSYRDELNFNNMMRTCKELHAAGVLLLLRRGVKILDRPMLANFAQFMRQDLRRFRHLRSLRINSDSDHCLLEKAYLHDLIWIIGEAKWLEKLTVVDRDFWETSAHSDVAAAIQQIPSLVHLDITQWKAQSVDIFYRIVRNIPSQIKNLEISFWNEETKEPVEVIPFLKPLAPYLETLSLGFASVFQPSDVVYPLVTTVHVSKPGCDVRDRRALATAFPNLTVLILDRVVCPMRVVDALRPRNRATLSTARWKSLDTLYGNLEHIYMLGIVCPVTVLSLDARNCITLTTEHGQHYLSSVLNDTAPKYLSLDLHECLPFLEHALHHGAQNLGHLRVRFKIRQGSQQPLVKLDNFLAALQGTNITYLRLFIKWQVNDIAGAFFPEPDTVSGPLLRMDYRKYALDLVDAVPTLRLVTIDLRSDKAQRSYYFGVSGCDGQGDNEDRMVTELNKVDGKCIQDEMERVWLDKYVYWAW